MCVYRMQISLGRCHCRVVEVDFSRSIFPACAFDFPPRKDFVRKFFLTFSACLFVFVAAQGFSNAGSKSVRGLGLANIYSDLHPNVFKFGSFVVDGRWAFGQYTCITAFANFVENFFFCFIVFSAVGTLLFAIYTCKGKYT